MMLLVAVVAAVALSAAGVLLALRLTAASGHSAEPVAPAPELALMLGTDLGTGRSTLVGFFDTDSDGCVSQAPRFGEAARRLAGDAESVAVIGVGRNSPDTLLASLGDIQTLVLEDRSQGELASGFGVTGFPSFFMLDGRGAITARGRSVEQCLVR